MNSQNFGFGYSYNKVNMTKIDNQTNNKFIMRILIVSLLIIVFASLEAMMTSKSKDLFDAYIRVNADGKFEDFINIILVNFLLTILEPVIIALYTFFVNKKYGVNMTYKVVFTALLLIRFVNLLLKFNFTSIFYYIILFLYLLLIISILTYPIKKGR